MLRSAAGPTTVPARSRASVALVICAATAAAAAAAAPRPRVVIAALLDDFGYASASFNRPPDATTWETRTPNLDALASAGVVLRRHYVHHFCSPSRSSLLSGRLPVHVQQTNTMPDFPHAGVPLNMTTLPELLRAAGAPVDAHVAGKWDVGGATPGHTPEGRGFASSLVYFSHAVDHFTQNDYCGPGGDRRTSCCCDDALVDLWDSGEPARALNGTAYADELFLARVLALIRGHDFASGRSLLIYYAPHATHDPLGAPREYMARLANATDDEAACSVSVAASATGAVYPGAPTAPDSYRCRATFEAMVAFLDDAFGRIRAALDAAGVWEQSLLLVSSDNGGQADLAYGGGTNWPLRGGKGSPWEGGVRAAAFASGGALPPAARGRVESGLMHVADWAVTLCRLLVGDGGGDACGHDARAAAAGLPPPDGFDMWPLLSGANATSPRVEVPISDSALVTGTYKLLLGAVGVAGWGGPLFPNASSPTHDVHAPSHNCGAGGCVFDVAADAGEHVDLAAALPGVAAALRARLAALRPGFYTNAEAAFACVHNASLSVQKACACDAGASVWGGYFGPYARPLYPGPGGAA